MSTTTERDSNLKIGWVSTYNTQCGIAAYSKHLIDTFNQPIIILAANTNNKIVPDDKNISRCWNTGFDSFENLAAHIHKFDLNCVVIQYHYGLFNSQSLNNLINWLSSNKKIILMIHSLGEKTNEIIYFAKLCNLVTVQTLADYKKLSSLTNCIVFPLPIIEQEFKKIPKIDDSILVGSYGFFFPNKGILELINAIKLLRDDGHNYRLRLVNAKHPSDISDSTVLQALELTSRLNLEDYVEFYTDFLTDLESLNLLSSCDIIVNSYQMTTEPTSASVRLSISTGIPVVVTPNSIFDDINDIVFKMPGFDPLSLAMGIQDTIIEINSLSDEYLRIMNQAAKWRVEHSYNMQGPKLLNLLQDL